MIGGRARGSAENFVAGEPTEEVRELLALQSPPFVTHRRLCGGMRDNGGSPLDGMNFCHQADVDEPGAVEQFVVGPGGELGLEAVADGIVFSCEEAGHHRQADPPAWSFRQLDQQGVGRQALGCENELPVLSGAHLLLHVGAAAVDLRAIPPVGLDIDMRGGRVIRTRRARRVGGSAHDLHGVLPPIVIGSQGDEPGIVFRTCSVAQPVTDHELNPGRHQYIECFRRNEAAATEEFAAHLARAWLEDSRLRVGIGVFEWKEMSEAGTRASHQGILQVVEGAIGRAGGKIGDSLWLRRGLRNGR